jgi:hypothetical protein
MVWRVEANVGLKMTAEEVAEGIFDRQRNDPKMSYYGVDPSVFKVDSGPSIGERLERALGAGLRRAENRRVPGGLGTMSGWDELRARLVGSADGDPMLVMFSTCAALIRTLPALHHDPDRPEDVDTESEDHAPDECRYAVKTVHLCGSPLNFRNAVHCWRLDRQMKPDFRIGKPPEELGHRRAGAGRYYFGRRI